MDLYKNLLEKRRDWTQKTVNSEVLKPAARNSLSQTNHPMYPVWYFSPIRGIPRNTINVREAREFARSGWAQTVMSAIKRAVVSTKWDVVVDEEFEDETKWKEQIAYVKDFLNNPNREEQQDFDHIIETILSDLLEIDAAALFLNGKLSEPLLEMIPYDGCLKFGSMIETDAGFLPIGRIVKDKIVCKVKSYNAEKGVIEWKQVTNWHNNGITTKWLRLKAVTNRKFRSLSCTPNHKVMTSEGYKLAQEIEVGDVLYTQQEALSSDQRQVILGSLLGDASLQRGETAHAKPYFVETHSVKQEAYLAWKENMLRGLNPQWTEFLSAYSKDYELTKKVSFRTRANIVFEEFYNLKYPEFKPSIIDELGPLGLAVWIQDDGHRTKGKAYQISCGKVPRATLEQFVVKLKERFGLEFTIRETSRENLLILNVKESAKLVEIIKPYIHQTLAYKVGGVECGEELEGLNAKTELAICETEVFEKEYYNYYDAKYDITVKDNHNYFAQGMLVSNSTFLKEQNPHGFLVKYWQFSYRHPISMPLPFEPSDIAYFQMQKHTSDPYGYSPLQAIEQVLELMDQATRFNKDFFANNAIPKIIMNIPGANSDSLKKFRSDWDETAGENTSITVHSAPDMKIEKLTLTGRDMEWLEGQKWYMHLVFAVFGVSPSEVGFTDTTGSKSVQEGQERVTIKNAHLPYLHKIESIFNRIIVPRILGEYEKTPSERSPIMFKYLPVDNERKAVEEENQRKDIVAQIITINEARQSRGLEPFDDERADDPFFNSFQAEMPEPGEEVIPGKKEEKPNNLKKPKAKEEKAITAPTTSISSGSVVKAHDEHSSKPYEAFFNTMVAGWKAEIKRAVQTQLYKEYEVGSERYARRQRKAVMKNFNDFLSTLTGSVNLISFNNQLVSAVKKTLDDGVVAAEKELDVNVEVNLDLKASLLAKQEIDGYTLPDGTKWVGLKGVSQQVQTAVFNKVRDGLALRKSTDSIVDDVVGLIDGISRSRGAAIVRTESVRMFNIGKLEAFKESGIEGKKEYTVFLDDRTTPLCRYMKGQTRLLTEPFNGPNGETWDAPPAHISCRSYVRFSKGTGK